MSGTISKQTFCDAGYELALVVGLGLPLMRGGNNGGAAVVMRPRVDVAGVNDCALALQSNRVEPSKVTLCGTQAAALQMGVSNVNAVVVWCANNNDQIPAEITDCMQAMVDYGLFLCNPDTNPYTDGTLAQQAAIIADGLALSITANYLALKYSQTVYSPLVSGMQSLTCPTSQWVLNSREPANSWSED